jgi:hypothetical protein
MEPGTKVSQAMDLARKGHFDEVPEAYPEGAWFTYFDKTCRYSCMMNEYIYWVITSILGSQDFPGRLDRIGNEWPLNTKEKVRTTDTAMYALITNPEYKMPTVLPDGHYRAKQFEVEAANRETAGRREEGLSAHFRMEAAPTLRPDFEIIGLDMLNGVLDRKIMVFGIPVFTYAGVAEQDFVRTAHVLAQWLDNDEDGEVDNRLVLGALAEHNSYVFIVENQGQVNTYNFQNGTRAFSVDAESIQRRWYTTGPSGDPDGTMEEPFHMISDAGYGKVYPEIFATQRGTVIADAMDIARGGYFERTPDVYPDGAWYTNPTKGCQYGCMVGEYFYWSMTSTLGVNVNRGEHIKDQWKLYTLELVEQRDKTMFGLLTDPKYRFATKYPDGVYGD